jgi:suppressor for copper-sensitivity B
MVDSSIIPHFGATYTIIIAGVFLYLLVLFIPDQHSGLRAALFPFIIFSLLGAAFTWVAIDQHQGTQTLARARVQWQPPL